jgi:SET domain-containing protein
VTAKTAIVEVDGQPHVCLFAIRDLNENEQVLYDYGVHIPFVDKVRNSRFLSYLNYFIHSC